MIIIDTNVLSEVMKPAPDGEVMQWLDSLTIDETAVTSITVAEIMYGIGSLPEGKRKTALLETAAAVFGREHSHWQPGISGILLKRE